MKKPLRTLLVAVLLFGSAQAASAQLWTAALGGVAGALSGGYISLSAVVTRAQFGHYLHEPKEIIGWNSLPVLIGAPTGAGLGMWAPDRLGTGFVYGSAATLAGGTAGFFLGWAISNRPEGKWAGGAIGAGLGMAIGSTLGVFKPNRRFDPTGGSNKSVIPITYQVRF
jgi:hypothetical protein